MGLSTNTYTYTGSDVFPVNFALGILERDYVQVQVNEEEVFGEPVYRNFEWIDDSNVRVTSPLETGDQVTVQRTVPKSTLDVSFVDGNVDVTQEKIDRQVKQPIMISHEILDGRIKGLGFDLDLANQILLAAEGISAQVQSAANSALHAQGHLDSFLELINIAYPVQVKNTRADLDTSTLAVDDVVYVLQDENFGNVRTALVWDGTSFGAPIFLNNSDTVVMSERGFIEGTDLATAQANDLVWAALEQDFNDRAFTLVVDGVYNTASGFHLLDRQYPVEFIGTTVDAELATNVVGTIAVRVRGFLNGRKTPYVKSNSVTYRGAWNAGNGWLRGDKPNVGAGNARWVWASPFEVVHVQRYESFGDKFFDSEYDGISMPDGIGSALITNPTIENCLDDGINPGGFTTEMIGRAENIVVLGGTVKFCGNVGLHTSGFSYNVHYSNIYVSRCGTAGFDFVDSNAVFENITCEYIGQPHPNDPDFVLYPGGIGFYNPTGGLPGASGIRTNASAREVRGIKVIGCKFNKIFDRDNRNQSLLNLAVAGTAFINQSEFDVIFDQRGLNPIYSCSNQVPIQTGNDAGNSNIQNSRIKIKAIFDETNKGGRSTYNTSSRNDVHIELINVGSTNALEVNAEGAKINVKTVDCVNGVFCSSNNTEINIDAQNTNDLSSTSLRYGISLSADNCVLTGVNLKNCGINLFNSDKTIIKGGITYEGTAGQKPVVIINTSTGSSDVVVKGTLSIRQEALTVASTQALIENRGDVYVQDVDVISTATMTLFNMSDGTGRVKLMNGRVSHAGRVYQDGNHSDTGDISNVADRSFVRLDIESRLAAGNEFIIRSNNSIFDITMDRLETSNTTQPFNLFDCEGVVIKGVMINLGTTNIVQNTNPSGNNNFSQIISV